MKSLRAWLLLLLAVLLPVRGALAVAMQCATPGAQAQVQAQLLSHGHERHAASSDHHDHRHEAAADPGHDHGDAHGTALDDAGAADKCNFCAASCSATGLVGTSATVAGQQRVSEVFPRLYAPPPSFVSGGQERPPRTI